MSQMNIYLYIYVNIPYVDDLGYVRICLFSLVMAIDLSKNLESDVYVILRTL